MKTKVIWEESDIVPGSYYYKNPDNVNVDTNIGYFASVAWKIGYLSGAAEENRYVSVAMNDGLVIGRGFSDEMGDSKEQFAKDLTDAEYIPLTGENLRKIYQYVTKVWTI